MLRVFRRPLTVLTVAVAAILGATTLAATSQATDRSRVKPIVVMVHGGWADSSGWNAEIRSLTERGYPVIAPANPLRGLATDAAYLRSVLRTIEGPIVLVGHSYGGAVISNAAVGVPNVKALVYIAAFAPDKGESLAQLVTRYPGTQITPDALVERPYPLDAGGTGIDLYLKASIFREAFAGDLPRATTDLMQATQRPFSVAAFTESSGEPAWRSLPSWYLLATQDNAIPPMAQEFMAARANANITRVRASHVPMLSQPRATTDLIVKAAQAATRP